MFSDDADDNRNESSNPQPEIVQVEIKVIFILTNNINNMLIGLCHMYLCIEVMKSGSIQLLLGVLS